MVAGLHDRFSHYLTPSELKEFDLPPHFAGIGVEVGDMRHGLEIARVFNNSPAARAGLQSGQVIVAVNGRPLQGLSRDQAVALIKGQPGTDVVLQIERPHGQPRPADAAADREDHARARVRAGGGLGHRHLPRQEAGRGGARVVHARRPRGSEPGRPTGAQGRRPRDRARPAWQRRRPGRGGAADREHLHSPRRDREHQRAQPAAPDADRRPAERSAPRSRPSCWSTPTPPPPRRS